MKLIVSIFAVFFLFFITSYIYLSSAQIHSADPLEVKAALVFNFLKFISWPSSKKELVLGILGDTPLEKKLLELNGLKIKNTNLKVKRITSIKEVIKCDAIFVGEIENNLQKNLFRIISQKPILTISDQNNFILKGGIIQIFLEKNKFHFKVNLSVAKKSGLKISSRLLRLAKEVI